MPMVNLLRKEYLPETRSITELKFFPNLKIARSVCINEFKMNQTAIKFVNGSDKGAKMIIRPSTVKLIENRYGEYYDLDIVIRELLGKTNIGK